MRGGLAAAAAAAVRPPSNSLLINPWTCSPAPQSPQGVCGSWFHRRQRQTPRGIKPHTPTSVSLLPSSTAVCLLLLFSRAAAAAATDSLTDWLSAATTSSSLLALSLRLSLSPNVLWMSLSLWFPHSPPLAHSVSLPSSFLFLWHTLQMLNTREREPKGSTVNCNCLLERKGGKNL